MVSTSAVARSNSPFFDYDLKFVIAWREPTPTDDYVCFIDTISKMVSDADKKIGSEASVGIGLPGMIDRHGVTSCPNVPCLESKNTVAAIESGLGRPVGIGNDARNFALSEANGGFDLVNALLHTAVLQVILGISTLLLVVPIALAASHQAVAMFLFTVALYLCHGLRRGTDPN